MKHSAKLMNELLREHFERRQDGAVVRYYPKTADAHEHWRHTGVCPGCLARSISCGRCAECGWRSRVQA